MPCISPVITSAPNSRKENKVTYLLLLLNYCVCTANPFPRSAIFFHNLLSFSDRDWCVKEEGGLVLFHVRRLKLGIQTQVIQYHFIYMHIYMGHQTSQYSLSIYVAHFNFYMVSSTFYTVNFVLFM